MAALNLLMWGLVNFSISYGPTLPTRVIGDGSFATIDKLIWASNGSGAFYSNVAYSGALAILANSITLTAGGDKMSWWSMAVFQTLWTIGVYVPLTHWQQAGLLSNTNGGATAGASGWMSAGNSWGYGVFDHAGAHHIIMAGGATSLVLSFAMGKLGEEVVGNKDYTNTMWLTFGLLGYLVMGDPLSQSGGAGPTLVNCFMSIAGAILTNCAINIITNGGKYDFMGEPNVDGIIEALQYGLVAMTAGASVISPMWAVFFGFFTVIFAAAWNFFVSKVHLHGLGQFSVFSVYFVGAACSSALTGLFANAPYSRGTPGQALTSGSFYGSPVQLGRQIAAICVVLLLTTVSSAVIYAFTLLVSKVFGNKTLTLDQSKIEEEKASGTAVLTSAA